MNLHQQFLQLAKQKQKITYNLLSLLPQIYELKIYKKYARTIHGYAWQFAQIPETVVEKTLKLENKLKDKPILRSAVKEVGIHKVSMVESLVTTENEEIMVEKIKNMSSVAIQSMAKELRKNNDSQTLTLTISADTQKLFSTVKKLLNISELSNDKAFEIMLEYIAVSTEKTEKEAKAESETHSRYIPARIKKKIKAKYDNKCSYPSCNKQVAHLHHQDRFAKSKNHQRLVPLCKVHHEFMHNSLVSNELEAVQYWKIQPQKTTNLVDLKYQKFRC